MNRDIEDQLRLTLRDRASTVDDTTDLSRAAIGRARTIRRNRTRLTVAAAVATVAAVVQAVLFTGDRLAGDEPVAPPSSVSPTVAPSSVVTPSRPAASATPRNPSSPPSAAVTTTHSAKPSEPTRATLDLARLPRGEAPRTVHLDGRTVVTPAGRVRVPGSGGIRRAAYAADRVFVITTSSADVDLSSIVELPIGAGAPVETDGGSVLRASDDSRTIAFATTVQNSDGSTGRGVTLYHRGAGTRSQLALPAAYGVDIHAVVGDAVYFSARDERQRRGVLRRWTAGEQTSDALTQVPSPVFVSADGRFAGTSTEPDGDRNCTGLVRIADGDFRWRTCDYSLRGLAGDAVLASPAQADGYADASFGVLDATTGKLLHEWRIWTLRTTVESGDTVLAEVEDDGKHALVRCAVSTGKCELATPLADGAGPDVPLRFRLGS